MNLSELARKLKVSPDVLRENLPKLGFDIGRKAIKVDDRVASKILKTYASSMRNMDNKFREEKKQAELEEAVAAASTGVSLPKELTVRELAQTLGISVPLLMTELMKNGILSSVNERLDFATASIVAEDLGFKVMEKGDVGTGEGTVGAAEKLKAALVGANVKDRPPVVVVMGHVDHGKTTLLDSIRKTDVAGKETGGITQHIGAYQVHHSGKVVTFIDTPGHEAFRTMRSRGAKVADIAILVVAADDGLKPQSKEALTIIKGAGLPYVVAINKIDKEDANIEKVKQELASIELLPEDWGGKTICVPISAKSGEGIDRLIEMVLLVAEMNNEKIVADPNARALGSVIEAHINPNEGPVATLLVQNGTLKKDDVLVHGDILVGKARMLKNYLGETVLEALPSMPVRILGLKEAPEVGDVLETGDPLKEYKIIKKKKLHNTGGNAVVKKQESGSGAEVVVPIVIKSDVLGSLEAIIESIDKFETEDARIQLISKGLGNVTEGDVQRAVAAEGAFIAAFRVLITREAKELAEELKVEIKSYEVIYDLIAGLKERLSAKLKPEIIHTDLGQGKVLAIFRQESKRQVVGIRVISGIVKKDARVKITRDGEVIGDSIVVRLQSGKEEVNEVASGADAGCEIKNVIKLVPQDQLEFYFEEEKKRIIK